jgi:hypothetical protein
MNIRISEPELLTLLGALDRSLTGILDDATAAFNSDRLQECRNLLDAHDRADRLAQRLAGYSLLESTSDRALLNVGTGGGVLLRA